MPRRKQLTFSDVRLNKGRGGPRTGAGRPRIYRRPPVHHIRRPRVSNRYPCHVRLRVVEGVPSLRQKRFIREFRQTLARASERGDFRVVHYSVQRNHVHLLVEASGKDALARGMKAVGGRVAKAVNRVFGRSGQALFGRYWLRVLRSPREVRHVLAYVLLNARRHFFQTRKRRPLEALDVCSSGAWFDGWRSKPPPGDPRLEPLVPDVAAPHTWLLSTGWRRHGLVDPAEVPGC